MMNQVWKGFAGGAVTILGLACLTAISPAVRRAIHDVAKGPNNTPIVIAGGSINGISPNVHEWKKISGNEYWAKLSDNNSDYISFSGFTSSPSAAITGTGGWVINYVTPHLPATYGLQLCSDSDCSANGWMNPDGKVYLRIGGSARLYERKYGTRLAELHFHESNLHCASQGDVDDPNCDVILRITTTSKNNNLPASLVCPQNTHCDVIVGKDN